MILLIKKINSQKIINLKIETKKYFPKGILNTSEYENVMEYSITFLVKRGRIDEILTKNIALAQTKAQFYIKLSNFI